MKYLDLHEFQVIAMRDLDKYVDPEVWPEDYSRIIELRQQQLEAEGDR